MKNNTQVIPIREQIANQIRTDVIGGQMEPGQRLREEELAVRFGVSRGPIRDVLLQLTKEGLLVSKRNCGVTVNEMLSPLIQNLMITLRKNIEMFAFEMLEGKLDNDDFVELKSFLDGMQAALKAENFTEAAELDLEFHKYLLEKAGGDELLNLWTPMVLRMRMNYQRICSPEQSMQEHWDILDALKASDFPLAIKLLETHIK